MFGNVAPEQSEMLRALRHAVMGALPEGHAHPELARFHRLIRDYPERGGKGLRGLLLLLSTAAHGLPWTAGLESAAALELFQNWVLIHDDIEDDSLERRGGPALHKEVGMPVALNVGDALHVCMWRTLHRAELPPGAKGRVLEEFSWMILRTAEGQHLDLSWVQEGRFDISEENYLEMVTLKTALYTVVCPLRLGALCADREPDERFYEAGQRLGVAFQIRDDVLNLMPEISYGKEFAGDLYEAKRTLILAHLFAHATPSERDEVCERLAKNRSERTPEDVEAILGFFERYGSLRYAQGVAEENAREGLTLLREALETLPGEAAGELLKRLESLASRKT